MIEREGSEGCFFDQGRCPVSGLSDGDNGIAPHLLGSRDVFSRDGRAGRNETDIVSQLPGLKSRVGNPGENSNYWI